MKIILTGGGTGGHFYPLIAVAQALNKKAAEKKITAAVFDRRSYKFHGRVKSVAEGARKGGLKI